MNSKILKNENPSDIIHIRDENGIKSGNSTGTRLKWKWAFFGFELKGCIGRMNVKM